MNETNKSIAKQVMNALSDRDLDRVRAYAAPGSRFYGWAPEPLDADGHKGFMAGLLVAFPDSRIAVDDIIAEGDKVAVRHRLLGTVPCRVPGDSANRESRRDGRDRDLPP